MICTRWIVAILLAYMLAVLFWWQHRELPIERFPEWTPQERKAITKAIKRHGYYTAITTVEGTSIRTDNGLVWIERRGK